MADRLLLCLVTFWTFEVIPSIAIVGVLFLCFARRFALRCDIPRQRNLQTLDPLQGQRFLAGRHQLEFFISQFGCHLVVPPDLSTLIKLLRRGTVVQVCRQHGLDVPLKCVQCVFLAAMLPGLLLANQFEQRVDLLGVVSIQVVDSRQLFALLAPRMRRENHAAKPPVLNVLLFVPATAEQFVQSTGLPQYSRSAWQSIVVQRAFSVSVVDPDQ